MAGLHAGAQAEDQLYKMEVAREARDTQSKQGQKRVGHAKGGVMYVKDARATKLSREQKEIAKDNRVLVQMWEAEENKNEGVQARAQRQAEVMNTHFGESTNDQALQFYLRLRPKAAVEPFLEFIDDMEID